MLLCIVIALTCHQVCSILPHSLSQECTTLLDQYGPVIIQKILNKESPDTICAQLKVCGQRQPQPVDSENGASECVICQYITSKVYGYLSEPVTEEHIAEALVKVCDVLPGAARVACESLLDSWSGDIVAFILAKEQPDVICRQLHACSA